MSFCAPTPDALPVHAVTEGEAETLLSGLGDRDRIFAKALGFAGKAGQVAVLPGESGEPALVLAGLGDGRDSLAFAAIPNKLPGGVYQLADDAPEGTTRDQLAIAWADGAYRFRKYLKADDNLPRLTNDSADDFVHVKTVTDAMTLIRDLVNTPAEDMGPTQIEAAIRDLAEAHGGSVTSVVGDDLLTQGYPMVHGVGRVAADAPRIVELSWGDEDAPRLAIVGKGVAFDTGGLDLKTNGYMRHMKKDMGGAAHAIGLAHLVMARSLPVRLSLIVPTVENAIGAGAFRPGDILSSRKGLTVEIDNTDAEGRLILGDALTRACELDPDLVMDFATLTGAARVALGQDLAPFYTDDEEIARFLEAGSKAHGDPVWRMPLWHGYEDGLKSPIADLKNTGDGPLAGSITAALFLKRFVDRESWVHFDIWAWRNAKYGRPLGAAVNGLRASWAMLEARYRR